jgi:hypothetical protein
MRLADRFLLLSVQWTCFGSALVSGYYGISLHERIARELHFYNLAPALHSRFDDAFFSGRMRRDEV